jgi:hypothetical protein
MMFFWFRRRDQPATAGEAPAGVFLHKPRRAIFLRDRRKHIYSADDSVVRILTPLSQKPPSTEAR